MLYGEKGIYACIYQSFMKLIDEAQQFEGMVMMNFSTLVHFIDSVKFEKTTFLSHIRIYSVSIYALRH